MNKVLLQIADMPWRRIVITGLVAGAFYWALLFNDGKHLVAAYDQAKQQLDEARKELAITKEKMADADRFEKEVKQTIDQFNRIVDLMPEKMSLAELTTTISDLCSKAGARLTKTEPRPSVEKVSFYEPMRIALTIEGTFAQIVMFLSYLSHIPRLMTFDHLDVALSPTATESESPRLVMNGVLIGYKYVRKLADEKPSVTPGAPGAHGDGHAKK